MKAIVSAQVAQPQNLALEREVVELVATPNGGPAMSARGTLLAGDPEMAR